jgi:lactate dehydrogenase-like 2-hydroxyacid dehydrogenase
MSKKIIALLDILPPKYFDAIKADVPDGFELHPIKTYDEPELIAAISQADFILVGGNVNLCGKLLEAAKKVKLIAKRGVGYDRIDVQGATAKGIPVTITPVAASPQSVAEHTILLILAVLRRLKYLDNIVRNGGWRRDITESTYQLGGKTVGLLGSGANGREVAKRLRVFNTTLIYYDIIRAESQVEAALGLTFCSLEELFSRSDVLTLHLPLTPDTRNLINERVFSLMKPNAVIVNTSRGAIVDEHALIKALQERRIMGAGLDVFVMEPLPRDHPFIRMENVIMTPHWAVGDIDTIREQMRRGFANIIKVAQGEPVPESDLILP